MELVVHLEFAMASWEALHASEPNPTRMAWHRDGRYAQAIYANGWEIRLFDKVAEPATCRISAKDGTVLLDGLAASVDACRQRISAFAQFQ